MSEQDSSSELESSGLEKLRERLLALSSELRASLESSGGPELQRLDGGLGDCQHALRELQCKLREGRLNRRGASAAQDRRDPLRFSPMDLTSFETWLQIPAENGEAEQVLPEPEPLSARHSFEQARQFAGDEGPHEDRPSRPGRLFELLEGSASEARSAS